MPSSASSIPIPLMPLMPDISMMAVEVAGYQNSEFLSDIYGALLDGTKEFGKWLFGVHDYGVKVAVSWQGPVGAQKSTSNEYEWKVTSKKQEKSRRRKTS